MKRSFGLKYKLIIASSTLSILMVGLLAYLALHDFKKDKLAQVYQSNLQHAHSSATQVRTAIQGHSEILLQLTKGITEGKTHSLTQLRFQEAANLLQVQLFKKEEGTGFFKKVKELKKLDEVELDPKSLDDLVREAFVASVAFQILDQSQNLWLLAVRVQGKPGQPPGVVLGKIKGGHFFRLLGSSNNGITEVVNKRDPNSLNQKKVPEGEKSNFWNTLTENQVLTQGTASLKQFQGQQTWLTARAKVGVGELEIYSLTPLELALQPVQLLTIKFTVAFLLFMFLIFIGSILFAKGLTKNLHHLITAVQKVRDGDLTTKVQLKVRDEIGDLAGHFNVMTEKVRDLMSQTAEAARMESELETAKIVQANLFPDPFHEDDEVKISGFYQSASECGGDWWFHSQIGSRTFLWIGDATGHGASAALVTSAAKSAANVAQEFENVDIKKILSVMNNAIYETTKGKVNMTFFLACYDRETQTLAYSRASHDPPLLMKQDLKPVSRNSIIPLFETAGRRLGERRDSTYDVAELKLDPGDRIFFYTDGITELYNSEKKMFGDRKLVKLITQSFNSQEPIEDMMKHLEEALSSFRADEPLHDDLTYFVFERKAS